MAQEQTTRQTGGGSDEGDDESSSAAGHERRDKLASDTTDILDEIDDVLETNAEEFVRSFVQKGGQ